MELKISDITPKGSNLSDEDLLVISEFATGPIYTSKSITGLEIKRASNLFLNANASFNYTLTIFDEHHCLIADTSLGSFDIFIDVELNVNFPIGTEIKVMQKGTNQLRVLANFGVTLNSFNNLQELAGQFAVASLIKINTDEWVLSGNLI